MSMVMQKGILQPPLVTPWVFSSCMPGATGVMDGEQSKAHRGGSGSDQQQREQPRLVLMEKASVRGTAAVVARGRVSLVLAAAHCVGMATPTTCPTLSTPREARCRPTGCLQPGERFRTLSVPFLGQHGMKRSRAHGAVRKLCWQGRPRLYLQQIGLEQNFQRQHLEVV